MKREFVAYDKDYTVTASHYAERHETLAEFAALFPCNDVAEVINDREIRYIKAEPSRT